VGPFKEVESWKAKDGAILVRVDFLDAAGNIEEQLPDSVVPEHILKPDAFAYVSVSGERPHFHVLDGFTKDGDELQLMSGRTRLVLSPIWNKEQKQELSQFRREIDPEYLIQQMEGFFNEVQGDVA
jgi:hypothetical protein